MITKEVRCIYCRLGKTTKAPWVGTFAPKIYEIKHSPQDNFLKIQQNKFPGLVYQVTISQISKDVSYSSNSLALKIFLKIVLLVYLSIILLFIHLYMHSIFIYPSTCPSIYPSIIPSTYPSIYPYFTVQVTIFQCL